MSKNIQTHPSFMQNICEHSGYDFKYNFTAPFSPSNVTPDQEDDIINESS